MRFLWATNAIKPCVYFLLDSTLALKGMVIFLLETLLELLNQFTAKCKYT